MGILSNRLRPGVLNSGHILSDLTCHFEQDIQLLGFYLPVLKEENKTYVFSRIYQMMYTPGVLVVNPLESMC